MVCLFRDLLLFGVIRFYPYPPGFIDKRWDHRTASLVCIVSCPLFADADTGIYPHAASQYYARPKAKRGIVMIRVDKFPYPRKQTRGNEFIPSSNNICHILKRFHSFKIPAIPWTWPKSPYKHSVTRSYRSGKVVGIAIVTSSMRLLCLNLYLTLMTSNVRCASIFHSC